ncbi:DUF58 domain-containing protein [Flavobacteriaceae bacterium]|nr:DUF58 domain-containing protein [Flavobacteriaceae bacterium]
MLPNFKELVKIKDKAKKINLFSPKRHILDAGGQISNIKGRGMEFDQVRAYEIGDDVKNIHWKITAKTNEPHVKTFIEEKQKNITICVDVNEGMNFGTRNVFKSVQAARIAAIIAWKANSNNDRIGGCLFGGGKTDIIPDSKSELSILKILRKLSKNKISPNKTKLSNAIKEISKTVKNGSTIFIISDFLDIEENLTKDLSMLQSKNDVIFIAVNDPFDKELPKMGKINLNSNGKKFTFDCNNQDFQKNYQRQWQDNSEKLQTIMKNLMIPKVDISTESNILKNLRN